VTSAGVLLSDDGHVYRLDSDYVIGREPITLPGNARALVLTGDTSGVSRHHARVSVGGSRVCVTDLGSTNGTFLLLPDASQPRLVEAGESVDIPSGTQIMLAKRSFYYESLGDFGKRG
jgi:pSer/pThr/pTyr-binding forkhead associated (FHA) protein